MTSAPCRNCVSANSFPEATSVKLPVYPERTLISGLMDLAPAIYPASNFSINGPSIPPMKPIMPVFDIPAAIAPTKNDPSSSAKISEATFGASTTLSTMAKLTSGKRGATAAIASVNRYPTPTTKSYPSDANLVRLGSSCANSVDSTRVISIPNSASAFFKASQPKSENPLTSSLAANPPRSVTIAALNFGASSAAGASSAGASSAGASSTGAASCGAHAENRIATTSISETKTLIFLNIFLPPEYIFVGYFSLKYDLI